MHCYGAHIGSKYVDMVIYRHGYVCRTSYYTTYLHGQHKHHEIILRTLMVLAQDLSHSISL